MTRRRNDDHSTPFGLWLRDVPELDSRDFGFRAYNIDFVWARFTNGRPTHFMLLEEKRYKRALADHQTKTYEMLDEILTSSNDPRYYGFHVLKFENTTPDDGEIRLDLGRLITKDYLIDFLSFRLPPEAYRSTWGLRRTNLKQ